MSAAGTQEPLAGAQITVVGGMQRATSDDRGRFRLTGLTGAVGAPVTIEVRRIGYRESRVATRVGDTNVGLQLSVNPTSLEAVVVTGTPGATDKRAIGNAGARADAAVVPANLGCRDSECSTPHESSTPAEGPCRQETDSLTTQRLRWAACRRGSYETPH